MAMSCSSIGHAAPVAATGFGSVFEGRSSSSGLTCSTVTFRKSKAGHRSSPRASFATDVWGAVRTRFSSSAQGASYVKLGQSTENRRCGSLASAPSDVVTIEDSVEVEKPSEEALVSTLLSLVKVGDRGAELNKEEQGNIENVVNELEQFGMPEPLESPLVFGDWDVAYASNPTSPGGLYRTFLGRLIFKTKDMVQTITPPDFVVNVVRFAFLGFIAGQVILQGKLLALEKKLVQVDFEPPTIQLGPFKFTYGRASTVKLTILYLSETVRLGRGSRGTVFVFTRRSVGATLIN